MLFNALKSRFKREMTVEELKASLVAAAVGIQDRQALIEKMLFYKYRPKLKEIVEHLDTLLLLITSVTVELGKRETTDDC